MRLLGADPSASDDAANKVYVDRGDSGVPSYALPSDGSALASKYDNTRGVYNYKSANTRILDQGLSDSMAGGISHHLVFGDSVSAGATSGIGVVTYDRLHAWPLMMRDQLALTGVPANGTGFVRVNDAGTLDARWVLGGTWASLATSPIFVYTTTNGASATLTLDRSGSMIEVWYYDAGSVTFTISIDGATSGVNFATVTTAAANNVPKKIRLTGRSLKIGSTIKITVTTIGSGFVFYGAGTWTPNAGLVVHNVAQSGSWAGTSGTPAKNWNDFTNGPYFAYKDIGGRARTITDAVTTAGSNVLTSATANFTSNDQGDPIYQFPDATGALFPPNTYIVLCNNSNTVLMSNNALVSATGKTVQIGSDPDCVHICLGNNDIMGGATPDSVATAITSLRGQYPNSDCILHLENEPSRTLATVAQETAFQQRMYKLADDLNVPLYDWRDRAGSYETAFANGVMQDYQAHMTPGMYADLGASLAWIMGGGSAKPQHWTTPVYDGDLVNKRYVDAAYKPVSAPSTYWQFPATQMGVGTSTVVTSGNLTFLAVDVGPNSKTFTALGVGVGTAQVAGTTTTTLAIYPDDGTGGQPSCGRGPIASGTVTLTATGNRTVATTFTLAPGRYWVAFLYVASVAPTTAPLVYMITNSFQGPGPNSQVIGASTSRGWILTGQSAMPTTDIRSSLASVNSTLAPIVAIQAQ